MKEKAQKQKSRKPVGAFDVEVSDDCPICHVSDLCCQWICCDNCDVWYHTQCTDVNPDIFQIFFIV